MKRFQFAAAAAAALILFGGPARAIPAADGRHHFPSVASSVLQDTLDDARAQTRSPGASAAIVKDGKVLWAGSSGVADRSTGAPVTPGTLYSLASVTKMFVATTVLRLYEQGEINLDAPIAPLAHLIAG